MPLKDAGVIVKQGLHLENALMQQRGRWEGTRFDVIAVLQGPVGGLSYLTKPNAKGVYDPWKPAQNGEE